MTSRQKRARRLTGLWAGAGLAGLVSAAALVPAGAAEMPTLKVFVGTPSEKGRWRMTFDKVAGGADASMAGHSMSVCADAAREMAKDLGKNDGESRCTFRIIEDSSTRAVFESSCPDQTLRTSITREGPTTFFFAATSSKKDGVSIQGRYSYEGPCSADGPVILADGNGAECRQARASLAKLDPAKACGSLAGKDRTTCEEQIRKSKRTLEAVCQ